MRTSIAAFALAEAINLRCLLSKACAIRDNRWPPRLHANLEKTMSDTELTSGDFADAAEPFRLFATWLDDATRSELNDPNGVALATVDADGMPDVRMVLLKGFDEAGFVFYTNFESAKGQELLGSMKAAMCFHWKSLRRQVRLRGPVEIVSDAEADAYYATRPRGSRIGAWASKQSRPLESRFALEKAVAEYTARYAIGEIPRPKHWSGFRIVPQAMEFWHDRPFRLHDRIAFSRNAEGAWDKTRLYP
jgi:pyridoxamine 5'-phosphate oxidase